MMLFAQKNALYETSSKRIRMMSAADSSIPSSYHDPRVDMHQNPHAAIYAAHAQAQAAAHAQAQYQQAQLQAQLQAQAQAGIID
jgi:hypothetical protein